MIGYLIPLGIYTSQLNRNLCAIFGINVNYCKICLENHEPFTILPLLLLIIKCYYCSKWNVGIVLNRLNKNIWVTRLNVLQYYDMLIQ